MGGAGERAMIGDVLDRPCRDCGEHIERLRVVPGKLAAWWLVVCACGKRWIAAVAWPRARSRKAA
jgi:hypothetical protein